MNDPFNDPMPPQLPERDPTGRKVVFYTLAVIIALLALTVTAIEAITCAIFVLTAVIIAKD